MYLLQYAVHGTICIYSAYMQCHRKCVTAYTHAVLLQLFIIITSYVLASDQAHFYFLCITAQSALYRPICCIINR